MNDEQTTRLIATGIVMGLAFSLRHLLGKLWRKRKARRRTGSPD